MAAKSRNPQNLGRRIIRRRQIQQGLLTAALISSLALSSCGGFLDGDSPPPTNRNRSALFYENQQQCETEVQQQQNIYTRELKAFNNKQRPQAPNPPALAVADCAPRMLAAQREHDRHAPIYRTLQECQAEGVRCERAPSSSGGGGTVVGYRPRFGGSFFFPNENSPQPQERNYPPRTVYSSTTPGQVVTPEGETLSQNRPGLVSVPERMNTFAPSRPQGFASRGTITGRSSRGFGSTYRGSGQGGK